MQRLDRPLEAISMGRERLAGGGSLQVFREDTRANLGSSGLRRGVLGLFYCPGLQCIVLHRLAAWAYAKPGLVKVLGILIWRFNVSATGAYLHPSAKIAPGLRLPHPVGVVVGNGVVVEDNVTLYQNATLGVAQEANWDVYPVIGRGATVYCGAVVIGGIRVGAHAVVGANAVVTKDVPDLATAVGVPARVLVPKRATGPT